jgi:hypothetical protein
MLIKFLRHGTGDPHKAVKYLLADVDHNATKRPEVTVLRGNPQIFASVAASLSTVHRYTSVVIAWAPGDDPTAQEISDVCDGFEHLAFAGLEPEQYCHTVVSHGDHVHILVARVDLNTGKAFNIAPPQWRTHFDHLRDHWNYKMGWARPDDPSRARLSHVGGDLLKKTKSLLTEAERVSRETGFEVSDILGAMGAEPSRKQLISDYLSRLVYEGAVKNRRSVIDILSRFGSINRQGEDYVSIKSFEGGPPMRFKGAMFKRDFNAEVFLRLSPAPSIFKRSKPDLIASEKAEKEMEEMIERRKAYYRQRLHGNKRPPRVRTVELNDSHIQTVEIKEQKNERDKDAFVEKALRTVRASRDAVACFVRACIKAVSDFRESERSVVSAQRAVDAAQRAVFATRRACFDAKQAGLDAERENRRIDAAIATLSADSVETSNQRRSFPK